MTYWLKLIGSSVMPLTGPPYNGIYDLHFVGFRKKGKPSIRKGDYLFLYAPGGSKRIFALVEALTNPEADTGYNPREVGSCPWKIGVSYVWNPLPVNSGIYIDQVKSRRPNLVFSLQQKSHIRLFPEEIESAYHQLEKISKT